ncbi:uncharacterized protein LOC135482766 [Lineus longissimus]|uniref:uncharacterized protein LOC135482766 n=1 Tax=Lineus longissimus TaxID=88925 RepID=UPI00315D3B18
MSTWLRKLQDKRKRRSWSLDKTNAKIRRTLSDPLKSARDAFDFVVQEESDVIAEIERTNEVITAEKQRTDDGTSRFLFGGRNDSCKGESEVVSASCRGARQADDTSQETDYFTDFFKVPIAVAGWFILGISISNLNKFILTSFEFNFPIALTAIQMLTSFCINHFLLTMTPLRIYNTPLPGKVMGQIYILSALFSGSIALGNVGLKYLYVSFAKMIMATSPAVTVVLAKCMTGIQLTQSTYTSLIPLCGGTILCAVGEVNFHWAGFAAMIGSTVLRAFRSLFEGRLLKEEKVNSLALLYHISLPSSCILGLATIIWEGDALMKEHNNFTDVNFLLSIMASCLNGIVYNILTFVVTFYTSPLTLKVLGNGGILLNIAVSVILFNHSMSMTSILGVTITLVGILLYQKSSMSS